MKPEEFLQKIKHPFFLFGLAAVLLLFAGYLLGYLAAAPKRIPIPEPIVAEAPQPEGERIDLNTATAEELCALPGIGEKTAKLIVEYRDAMGYIASLKELELIDGLGEKKLKTIEPYVTFSRPSGD